MGRSISIRYPIKVLLVIIGWGTSLAAITVGTIFEGFLLPTTGGGLLPEVYNASPLALWIFYLGSLGMSALAAMSLEDLGPTIMSFFAAFGLAAVLTSTILALPDLIGVVQTPGVIQNSAITFTFSALFPIDFFVNLVGTVLGAGLGERWFSR